MKLIKNMVFGKRNLRIFCIQMRVILDLELLELPKQQPYKEQ